MPALIDNLTAAAARLLLRDGTITAVDDVAAEFRRLRVGVDGGTPRWAPGCKVQFRLSGTTFRTFTPFAWQTGSVSFLVYHGGHGPATSWAEGLTVGTAVQMFGPRRSLNLDVDGPPILVGDETSFALAAAWSEFGTAPAVTHIVEATSVDASAAVLEHLAVGAHTIVERAPGDGHHDELGQHVLDAVSRHPGAALVLTGKAQTIRAIRGMLKHAGLSPTVRVKAYWDPNRTGLD